MATRELTGAAVLAVMMAASVTFGTLGAERARHARDRESASGGVAPGNTLELPYRGEDHSSGKASFQIINAAGGEGAIGVLGEAFWAIVGMSHAAGGMGVGGFGSGAGSAGVDGRSAGGYGVYGEGLNGVRAVGTGSSGSGVFATYKAGEAKGFAGITTSRPGSEGVTRGYLATSTNGVQGESDATGGKGIAGKANGGANAVGVYGESTAGMAGFFRGKVTMTESLLVKEIFADKITASKGLIGGPGAKMFQIDHPLYPADKFLNHASIESAEMKNLYDGIVTLDEQGAAWIALPPWFQALNQEFRYQLTCIGGYAPVYIDREIDQNRFRIAGGKPRMKVSWQVTGVRHDAYASAHPLQLEEEKTAAQRGKYLHPVELGFSPADTIHDTPPSVTGLRKAPAGQTAKRTTGDGGVVAKRRSTPR